MTTTPAHTQSKRSSLVALGAGNAIEWYDWNVYATFSAFFAASFFIGGSPGSGLLATLAVFAVGFIARPFGGMFFGWLADRYGRKPAMTLAVAGSAGGSLIIGITPDAHTIGIAAPVILVLARLLQGLAHGGEVPAAQTYLAEVAPREKRGQWSSLMYISGSIGILFGTVLGATLAALLTQEQMLSYGWRIAFIVGALLGLYTLYLRSRMPESEVFEAEKEAAAAAAPQPSMWKRMMAHPRLLARVIGLTVGPTVIYYAWAVAAPAFAISQHKTPAAGALWAGSLATVIFIGILPFWGRLSDRIGRRPVLLIGGAGTVILFLPLQALIQGEIWQLIVAMSIALVVLGSWMAIAPAVSAEIFPTNIRAAGIGVPYALTVAAFGGTSPYLQTMFAQLGVPSAFGWYAIGLMLISMFIVYVMPETRGKDLTT